MRISRWTLLALLAVLILATIIFLADQNRLPEALTRLYAFPQGDKVGHFCLMGGVAFCINLALGARRVQVFGLSLLPGSLLLTVAVTLEEISQAFFASRQCDPLDLAASLLGILILGRTAAWLSPRLHWQGCHRSSPPPQPAPSKGAGERGN